MLTAADSTNWPAAQVLAAGGFGDTTRVASSSSRMARDICLTNQAAVLDMLDAYQKTLSLLRHEIATGDQAIIEHTFEVAREEREMWMKASRRR
jgi:prephenate dehydrogenase